MADLDPEAGRLSQRFLSHLPAKIAVWLGLAVGICVPYFTLQRLELFPRQSVPTTPIDEWIPLTPAFIWAYLSIALLVPLAPGLADSPRALRRYAWGLLLLCLPCFLCFALLPVEGPRPEIPPEHPLYRWLVSVDRPSNSMPSLHAGLTVFSLLFGYRVLRADLEPGPRTVALFAGVFWGGVILYATLATKQHWFLDLPAGALLAWLAHSLCWRDDAAPRSR